MSAFLLGVLAGYGIAIPVGAIAVLIVQVGMRCGFWCAASAGAGAATADLLYAVLAVTGGVALAGFIEGLGDPVRWASAGLLALIALRGLARARGDRATAEPALPGRGEYVRTYGKFLGLTIVNPMTVVYFAAVVLGLGLVDGFTRGEGARFVAGAFLASLSWQTLLAAAGGLLGSRVSPPLRIGAAVVGNLLVLGMAAMIFLS
jgi:arginine exporter protein ArgO